MHKTIVPLQDSIFRVFCHHLHGKEEISSVLVSTYSTDYRKSFILERHKFKMDLKKNHNKIT